MEVFAVLNFGSSAILSESEVQDSVENSVDGKESRCTIFKRSLFKHPTLRDFTLYGHVHIMSADTFNFKFLSGNVHKLIWGPI